MSFLGKLFGGLTRGPANKAKDPATEQSPAAMMRKMRLGWLTRPPTDEDRRAGSEVVTSVVMDWPLGDQIVSILSGSNGDASVYTTGTFGIIGGIGHEQVRKAAIAFVACTQHYLPLMTAASDFPYPDSQTLRIYAVTPAGVQTISFQMRETEVKDSNARMLYAYGQQVLTELRLITPLEK
jgi:hypothetical protein